MVLAPSFLQPCFHAPSRVSVFETPPLQTLSLQSRPITLLPAPIDKFKVDGSIATNMPSSISCVSMHCPKILPIQPCATIVLQPLRQSHHQTDLSPIVLALPKKSPSNQARALTRHQKTLSLSCIPCAAANYHTLLLLVIFRREDQIWDQNPSLYLTASATYLLLLWRPSMRCLYWLRVSSKHQGSPVQPPCTTLDPFPQFHCTCATPNHSPRLHHPGSQP